MKRFEDIETNIACPYCGKPLEVDTTSLFTDERAILKMNLNLSETDKKLNYGTD
jgi:hypothetical protein